MLVAMANHVLNSMLVVCFNAEAKEGDRGRVAVLDKVMIVMMIVRMMMIVMMRMRMVIWR